MNTLSNSEKKDIDVLLNSREYKPEFVAHTFRDSSIRALIAVCVRESSINEVQAILDTTDFEEVLEE